MIVDAIVFVVSQPNLSARRLAELQASFIASTDHPSVLCRLEGGGPPLVALLDDFRNEGYTRILVQPLGLPFSEGLLVWLRGALSDWQNREENRRISIFLGRDISTEALLAKAITDRVVALVDTAQPVATYRPSLGKPGWDEVPCFAHHLLVCTGARCQYRGAASLLQSLKDEISQQGVSRKCLTTRTGCLQPCNKGPMVAVYPRGEWYCLPDSNSVSRFVSSVVAGSMTLSDLLIHSAEAAGAAQ